MINKFQNNLETFENLSWCFILEGNGRGTKLLQSYLDGSNNTAMIPGYASQYFFPFLKKYEKKNDYELIKLFFYHFESIFNSKKNPGSESLHKLGPNKNEFLKINKDKFNKSFINYLSIKKKTVNDIIYNRFKAIHYAYLECNKINIKKLKIIISHIHAFNQYKKYVKIYFPNEKIIATSSIPNINFSRRVKNSLLRPNYEKLYYSDFTKSIISSFYLTCRFFFEGILDLKELKKNQLLIVYFEDLKINKERTLKRVCLFLKIKFSKKKNMRSTFGKKNWNFSYYAEDLKSKKIEKFDKIINYPINLENYEKKIFDYIFFHINNKKFDIKKKSVINSFLIYLYVFIPFQIEIKNLKNIYLKNNIKNYIKNIWVESNIISQIKKKYFKKNLFYTEKWSSKYLFLKFSLININIIANKWVYLLIKFLFLIYAPLVFLLYYFARVFMFIKIVSNSIKKKNKIESKLFT
jgi:hypothetical protein